MAKLNKECILCKTKYSFCNRCEAYDHLPRWMAIYCSDNCRTIFTTATDYEYKHINKEDARKILDNCDLSAKDSYHPTSQRIIDEIYKDDSETDVDTYASITSEDIVASKLFDAGQTTHDDSVASCTISTSDYTRNTQVSLTNDMSANDNVKNVDDIVASVEKVRSNKKIKSKKNADIKQK